MRARQKHLLALHARQHPGIELSKLYNGSFNCCNIQELAMSMSIFINTFLRNISIFSRYSYVPRCARYPMHDQIYIFGHVCGLLVAHVTAYYVDRPVGKDRKTN